MVAVSIACHLHVLNAPHVWVFCFEGMGGVMGLFGLRNSCISFLQLQHRKSVLQLPDLR